MKIDVKEIYKNHSKKTQEYMQNVIDCLKQEYKEIPSSWRISLDLIADNYDMYESAKKELKSKGLVNEDKYERVYKNHYFQMMNTCQNTVINLLKQFALTPLSKSKCKNFDSSELTIDDLIS